jgi:hypothetical protein
LFIIGLSIYLWELNIGVAAALSALSIVMVVMALVTIILPVFYQSCPYKTPLGYFLVYLRYDLPRRKSAFQISSWKDWDTHQVVEFQKNVREDSTNGEWILEYLTAILNIRRRLDVNREFDFNSIVQILNELQPVTLKNVISNFISDRLVSILLDPESTDDLTGGIYARHWADLLPKLDNILPGALMKSIEYHLKSLFSFLSFIRNTDMHVTCVYAGKKFTSLEGTVAISRNLQLLGINVYDWQYNSMKQNLDFCLRFTNDAAEALYRHTGRHSIEPDSLPLYKSLQKPLRFWTGHGRNSLMDDEILSAGHNHLAYLSNLQSSEPNLSMTSSERHPGAVLSTTFSQDRQFVASGSEDGSIRVWNLHKGECEYELAPTGPINIGAYIERQGTKTRLIINIRLRSSGHR